MRMTTRVPAAVAALLTAALLPLSGPGAAARASGPERMIDEERPVTVGYAAVRLQGNVTQPVLDPATGAVVTDPVTGETVTERYVDGKVKVHRKKCRGCKWKFFAKKTTNKYGTYKVRVRVPEKGIWFYRVTVPGSDGYATTRTRQRAVYFD